MRSSAARRVHRKSGWSSKASLRMNCGESWSKSWTKWWCLAWSRWQSRQSAWRCGCSWQWACSEIKGERQWQRFHLNRAICSIRCRQWWSVWRTGKAGPTSSRSRGRGQYAPTRRWWAYLSAPQDIRTTWSSRRADSS